MNNIDTDQMAIMIQIPVGIFEGTVILFVKVLDKFGILHECPCIIGSDKQII